MTIADGTLVFKARNSIEARALAAHLANADVDAHVAGDVVDNVFGVASLGGAGSEVWVRGKDRAAAEGLIDAWRLEHGGPPASVAEPPRFALKSLFKATALCAAVAATSRLFGDDFRGFLAATILWFWGGLMYLSARKVMRRAPHDDVDDAD